MSLMGTLAKVAIGVVLAKGVQAVTQRAKASNTGGGNAGTGGAGTGGAGTGGLFGGAHSPAQDNPGRRSRESMGAVLGGSAGGTSQGGLGGMLEQLGGGGRTAGRASGGGLGDLLGGLTGGRSGSSRTGAGGGLGDLLGGLLGGGAAGGLGGLLGGLTGSGQTPAAPANNRSFGDVLNSSFTNQGEPDVEPTADQNAVAALMLSAMIQAAKSDGEIQDAEKEKLLGNLGDVSEAEMAFVQAEMAKKVDITALVRNVPAGLEAQVYTMSVMAIDLDSQAEAQYLHDLATALEIDKDGVNDIHAKLGVAALYA